MVCQSGWQSRSRGLSATRASKVRLAVTRHPHPVRGRLGLLPEGLDGALEEPRPPPRPAGEEGLRRGRDGRIGDRPGTRARSLGLRQGLARGRGRPQHHRESEPGQCGQDQLAPTLLCPDPVPHALAPGGREVFMHRPQHSQRVDPRLAVVDGGLPPCGDRSADRPGGWSGRQPNLLTSGLTPGGPWRPVHEAVRAADARTANFLAAPPTSDAGKGGAGVQVASSPPVPGGPRS